MELIASWEDPAEGALKPCLTLTTQVYLYATRFSEMSVRLSEEMTAALTSVWLSDTLTRRPSCSPQLCLLNCKKPKVCSVYIKGLCCFRNEKITLYMVMLHRSALTSQILQILTFWHYGHTRTHPKLVTAFAQLQKRIFFLLFSNLLSQKKQYTEHLQ